MWVSGNLFKREATRNSLFNWNTIAFTSHTNIHPSHFTLFERLICLLHCGPHFYVHVPRLPDDILGPESSDIRYHRQSMLEQYIETVHKDDVLGQQYDRINDYVQYPDKIFPSNDYINLHLIIHDE